jgi:hypothetical protein
MPCDTRLKPRQTIQQRATEVRDVVEKFGKGLATGRIKPVVDRKTGAIAFDGVTNEERDGVTDACAYRRLMVTGLGTGEERYPTRRADGRQGCGQAGACARSPLARRRQNVASRPLIRPLKKGRE